MMILRRVGVLAHPHISGTAPLAERIALELQALGLETWFRTVWNAENARPLVENSHMVIAIGGDGAMLHAARVCAPLGVPIFGMNAGHLGFLAEIKADEWEVARERLLKQEYWIEERMMLECEVWHENECVATSDALNDVVISRGAIARSVHLETYINNGWTTTYNADGLIISTPTGSTAYALAVGGPILPPELRNIMILPIAPHLSLDRSLVLSEDAIVKVIVAQRRLEPEVVVTVDGEYLATMTTRDSIIIKANRQVSTFIRLREPGYFFRSILDRMEPRLVTQKGNNE